MAYTQLEDLAEINLVNLFNFPSIDTPLYYPIFLFAMFLIVSLALFFKETNREGKGKILSSLAVGGYVTTAIAVVLTLLGAIQREIMIVVLVISLVFQVLYLLTGK